MNDRGWKGFVAGQVGPLEEGETTQVVGSDELFELVNVAEKPLKDAGVAFVIFVAARATKEMEEQGGKRVHCAGGALGDANHATYAIATGLATYFNTIAQTDKPYAKQLRDAVVKQLNFLNLEEGDDDRKG